MQKLRLMERSAYLRTDRHDPLPLYYTPVFGGLYRGRLDLCLNALQPGGRVLEVGYGSGISFLNLGDTFGEVHGIDLHRRAGPVRGIFAARGVSAKLCTGSVFGLPYADACFDAVLCVSILEHLQPVDLPLAVSEIARVLRTGGRFVYGIPCERPLMRAAFRLLGYDIREHHFSTERHVSKAADAALCRVSLSAFRPFKGVVGALYEIGVYERD